MKLLRILRRSERGAVLLVAIPALTMAIFACALGVDIGRIAVEKRSDQSVADLAALDASRAIGLMSTSTDAAYDAAAQTAATASAVRNGFVIGVDGQTLSALSGSIDATTNQFVNIGNSAVQVITTSYINNAFVPGGRTVRASGVSLVGSPIGAFSVGSSLASLDTSKSRLDPMLRTMFGATGSFSLVSYNGLAGANLSVGKLQTALLAAGLNVGTVDQLLTTNIGVRDLLTAMATALADQGSTTAAAEVNDIPIGTISNSSTVQLGDLLNITSPSDSAALSGTFNVYQMIVGSAEIINGTNFVSVPLTSVNLLGLAGVSLSAHVIEPAQTGIGPIGTTADNAQIAVKVNVDVGLGALLPVAHVALTYTTAEAHGLLTSIVCGASPSIGVSANAAAVAVSGVATTALGTMNISGSVAASSNSALSFSYPTEFAPVTKPVGTADSGTSLSSVTVTGSGATVALAPILQVSLPSVLATLDLALQPLIKPLLTALGLNLGSVDVAALGIFPDPASCGGHPRLVK